MSIVLGDRVVDIITEFQGIATVRHTYLNGCNRITVQPKSEDGKKLDEAHIFDEPQLKSIKAKKSRKKLLKTQEVNQDT